jgi:hypothetical protein
LGIGELNRALGWLSSGKEDVEVVMGFESEKVI